MAQLPVCSEENKRGKHLCVYIRITKEENMFCENDTIHWRDILLFSTIHPEEYFDDPRKASMWYSRSHHRWVNCTAFQNSCARVSRPMNELHYYINHCVSWTQQDTNSLAAFPLFFLTEEPDNSWASDNTRRWCHLYTSMTPWNNCPSPIRDRYVLEPSMNELFI